MLFNEPKLLKYATASGVGNGQRRVSVLFNEPKLLKLRYDISATILLRSFSALQRAEIAEMTLTFLQTALPDRSFSALQRAEIAEM